MSWYVVPFDFGCQKPFQSTSPGSRNGAILEIHIYLRHNMRSWLRAFDDMPPNILKFKFSYHRPVTIRSYRIEATAGFAMQTIDSSTSSIKLSHNEAIILCVLSQAATVIYTANINIIFTDLYPRALKLLLCLLKGAGAEARAEAGLLP